MTTHEVRFDPAHSSDGDYEILVCPGCGEPGGLHVDHVHVGGRPREDGDYVNVIVDHAGRVSEHVSDGKMAFLTVGHMRRHYMSLVSWYELCGGQFAYAFVQHKGTTKFQLIRSGWQSAAQV